MSEEMLHTPKKEVLCKFSTPLRLSPAYNFVNDSSKFSHTSTRDHSIEDTVERNYDKSQAYNGGMLKTQLKSKKNDYEMIMEDDYFELATTSQKLYNSKNNKMSTKGEELSNSSNFQKYQPTGQVCDFDFNSTNNTRRKRFNSIEEHQKFVDDYKKKYKTEICKNYEFRGNCQWGDSCSFAHGQQELRTKTHINLHYKSKLCKQFFESGFCSYGYRCQYLHNDRSYSQL